MGKQVKNLYWESESRSPSHQIYDGPSHDYIDDNIEFTNKKHIMDRQFISFSYDGRDIEEFDLIATMDKEGFIDNLYAGFEGRIKEFTELDGQQYYVTKYNPKTLTFQLVSDGMTEQQMSDFVHHFSPDKVGKLILSQHSYRYGEARLSDVPSITMVPYEKKVNVKIGGAEYETSTTEYKGKINVNFVLDKPFWRAKYNIIDINSIEVPVLAADGSNKVEYDNAINDKREAVKAIYEDGILDMSMMPEDIIIEDDNANILYGDGEKPVNKIVGERSEIDEQQTYVPFYYCGTAYTYPIISFSQKIEYDDTATKKIISPRSIKTVKKAKDKEDFYSYIKIVRQGAGENGEDVVECALNYTLPGTLMSYNSAMEILQNAISSSYDSIIQEAKEKITDYNVRSALIQTLNEIEKQKKEDDRTGYFTEADKERVRNIIRQIFDEKFTVIINCDTGVCKFKCKMYSVADIINEANEPKFTEIEVPCGDMLISRYMRIEGRDVSAIVDGKLNLDKCRKLITSETLENFSMSYNYQYL